MKVAEKINYLGIYMEATRAGCAAVNGMDVTPAIFTNDGKEFFYVADGACGFAWVVIRDIKFANFLKKMGVGRKRYNGGYLIWVFDYNQSMQKKEAYAEAFAQVLIDNGINAYAESKLD